MKKTQMSKEIIGMIHLWKIRGIQKEKLKDVIDKAKYDLNQLEEGWIEYACIINESDIPYKITISKQEKDCFLEIAKKIKEMSKIKLWVCILYNDRRSTLDIAKAIDADFVRIDTFVDLVQSDAGIIYPEADNIKKYQRDIFANHIKLLTDIHPKYKKMIHKKTLTESARQAFEKWSDWVIITWNCSWEIISLEELKELRRNIWIKKIFLWSGVSSNNISNYIDFIDWAFVWSSIKIDWRIDKEKTSNLVKMCR